MKYNSLQQAVIGVLQEKKITHPNQQAIDVHEPDKDEITAADFKKLRSMKKTASGKLHNCATHIEHADYGLGHCIKEAHADPDTDGNISWYTVKFESGTRVVNTEDVKIVASEGHMHKEETEPTLDDFTIEELEAFMQSEEAQQLDELSYDTLNSYMRKKRKQMGRATVGDAERLRGTPKGEKLDKDVANYRKAWAKRDMREDIDPVQETTILHDSFNVVLKPTYNFGDYLTAAKKLFGEEQAIEVANIAFHDRDLELFVEEMSHSAVEDKIKGHMKAGHKVSMPKYSTRDGKPRAEYVVTDKDSGVRRKYIHQGNVTKMENMGARGKRDEK